MKLNKTVKRIVALGTAATMLGATVLGAMAATDLSAYPKPMFIKDGKFNGLIVIGADADTQDMLGAMDIISSLQASTIGVSGSGSATVSTVGDVYEFAKSSNVLNLGESLQDIRDTLSKVQLPIVLADGTLTTSRGASYDYDQHIDIGADDILNLFADKDYKNEAPTIGIKMNRTLNVFNYSLDFSSDAKSDIGEDSDNEDDWISFEDRSIEMLGETYDIMGSDNSTLTLELMRGALKPTLEEGETQTYTINGKEYEVTLLIVEDTGDQKVKFKINGEVTDAMVQGDLYKTADGTLLGVREVIPNEAGDVTQDMVEFYLGAKKIVLTNDVEVEIDDEDVDDLTAYIDAAQDGDQIAVDEIILEWVADDDLFLTENKEELVMPGLESVKFYMDGFYDGKEEKITIEPNGDDAITLSAPLLNYDVALDVLYTTADDGTWDGQGADSNAKLLSNICNANNFTVDTDEWIVVTRQTGAQDGESAVIQVTGIGDADKGITVEDYEGNVIAKDELEDFDVADMKVSIVSWTEDVSVRLDVLDGDCVSGVLITKEGAYITLPVYNTPYTDTVRINIDEEDADENIADGVDYDIYANFNTDREATVVVPQQTENRMSDGEMQQTVDNSDVYVGYIESEVSSKITWDQSADQENVEISYPGEETYGNVFIGSKASKVTVSAAGEAVAANKIEVGAAVLDTSLATYTSQNLLVIGGPAINRATASLLGKTYPAYGADSGIAENSGMIKLVEQADGTVAVIVAGWEAPDTQRACRVLAESDMYAMSGSEVAVTGTSMTDITVGVPA